MPKRHLLPVLSLAALLPLTAGGVFYNSNQSAEYLRTFDRNSALDNADLVYYNMAGAAGLPPGWTVNLSNQIVFQRATVRTLDNPVLGDRDYRSHNPVWLLPNGYLAYRRGALAGFMGLEALGATAVREWPDGLPSLDLLGKQQAGYGGAASALVAADAYVAAVRAGATPDRARAAAVAAGLDASSFPSRSTLKGSSCCLAWRHGVAWQVRPWLSVAVAGRLVVARQELTARSDGESLHQGGGHDLRARSSILMAKTDRALGYSGELGLDLHPLEGLVVTLTYEMATPLTFRASVAEGQDGGGRFRDGQTTRLDLPAALRFGVGYQATPRLRASLGASVYLEGRADFSALDNPDNGVDHRRDYRDTYEESAALEVRLSPRWLVSAGINLNQIGQARTATSDLSLAGAHARYLSLGTGFQFQPTPALKLNLGLGRTRFTRPYDQADLMGDRRLQAAFAAQGVAIAPSKAYDKSYLIVALGLDYRFGR